jgi:hypothetical protein
VSVRRLWALFAVNCAWYTAHASGPARQSRDAAVREQMAQIRVRFPCYGYRRMTHPLRRAGWRINHKCVRRLLAPHSAAPPTGASLHSPHYRGAVCVLPVP